MKDFFNDTRKVLAYFWSFISALILIYIVIIYGADKAIINLIIGFIVGTVGTSLFGYYFSDSAKKPEPTVTTPVSNGVEVNVNSQA